MLVLTRKPNEGVDIYHEGRHLGRVVVCSVQGQRVRLGCEGPASTKFLREELSNNPTPPKKGKAA